MRINRRHGNALIRLLSSRSPRSRLAALLILIPLVLAIWQGCTHRQTVQPRAEAGYIVGDVIAVSDGDTIRVLDDRKKQHKIRFAFVDAPEKAQPYGTAAKQALSDKIYRKVVKVEIVDRDQYGRTVGRVWLDGDDINYLQLKQGWAWHYRFFAQKNQAKDDFSRYEHAESDARRQAVGLWQGNNPEEPWTWRRSKRNGKPKQLANESDRTGGE